MRLKATILQKKDILMKSELSVPPLPVHATTTLTLQNVHTLLEEMVPSPASYLELQNGSI